MDEAELARLRGHLTDNLAISRLTRTQRADPGDGNGGRGAGDDSPHGFRTTWRSTPLIRPPTRAVPMPPPGGCGQAMCCATTTGSWPRPCVMRSEAAAPCWSWSARPPPARRGRAGILCSRSPRWAGSRGIRSTPPGPGLRPEYARQYAALPTPGIRDLHSRTRELHSHIPLEATPLSATKAARTAPPRFDQNSGHSGMFTGPLEEGPNADPLMVTVVDHARHTRRPRLRLHDLTSE